MLQRADPIYVSPDVMLLWERAVETFVPEPLHRTDLVAPAGFMLLPRPMPIRDVHGQDVKFRAMSWLPVSQRESMSWDEGVDGQGVWVSMYSNVDDPDETWEEADTLRAQAKSDGYRWSLLHGSPMSFESSDWESDRWNVDEARVVRGLWTVTQAAWRLMSQLVPVREPLHRQARRQRKRMGMTPDVTVIRLRRPRTDNRPDDAEGADVDWRNQWVVRGHWRRQWYPSIKMHRQIWISPYVKGPEDKPLKVSRRAFEWVI